MKTILAHRGITYNYNDNTKNSLFEIFKYKSSKVNLGVELDINITKDNLIVVYHDEKINEQKICDLNYKDILNINSNIPLLEEILIEFNNTDYFVDIEVKSNTENKIYYCNLIHDLVSKFTKLNYFFSSFDKDICTLLGFENLTCYKILDIDEKPKESNFLREYKFLNFKNKEKNIVHHSYSNSNSIGVYTIYDKEFDEKN